MINALDAEVASLREQLLTFVVAGGGFAGVETAASIHDFEIGLAGCTSEDVEAVLPDGRFGAAEERAARERFARAKAVLAQTPLVAIEGDILRIEGPHGSFYLREDGERPLLMVAGGTGFAPLKAIVEDMIHRQIVRPCHFYWGARDRAGLYLHELAAGWVREHEHLRYIPVLSDPAADDAWSGRTGLVHTAVLADHVSLAGFDAYVCGAPAMIEAAKRDFIAAGLPAERFFADVFSYAVPGAGS